MKEKKSTDIDNITSNIKIKEEILLKENLENEEWFTVEDVRKFVKNNVREIYIANGDL
jgi:hypothetical protein